MRIHCLGINHRTADLALREQLAFTEESLHASLARLGCGEGLQPDSVTEMVILSTCNRVELYAVAPHAAFEALEAFLADIQGVSLDDFRPHLYRLADREAVAHLFRVAAGLDSLVLGEAQILGQVTHAYALARNHGTVGKILGRLFQTAIHAGKRARAETAISRNSASISSLAVRLAEDVVSDLAASTVLVLGAGEMAELAVEALRKRGVQRIRVVNRTLERARQLAERWDGEAATFEALSRSLVPADILITSTDAPHTLIHFPTVAEAMRERPERPLVILDIAVPRDVDPEAGELPGVTLFDLDDLQRRLENSLSARAGEIPGVEAILEQERSAYFDYLRTLEVVPLIAEVRRQAEAIRQAELEKSLRRLPDLSPEDRLRLDALTRALVQKILHTPIQTLRAEAGGPNSAEYAAVARQLFGLDGNSHSA